MLTSPYDGLLWVISEAAQHSYIIFLSKMEPWGLTVHLWGRMAYPVN